MEKHNSLPKRRKNKQTNKKLSLAEQVKKREAPTCQMPTCCRYKSASAATTRFIAPLSPQLFPLASLSNIETELSCITISSELEFVLLTCCWCI